MRLIDADKLEEKIESDFRHKKITGYDRDLLLHYLDVEMAPTVDVQPVVHGKWIDYDDDYGNLDCSVCDGRSPNDTEWPYCPYCGARMNGE